MEWADEWWRRLSGPRKLVDETVAEMNSCGVVILRVPNDLRRRHTLRAVLENKARTRNEEIISLDELDIRDECPNVSSEDDAGHAVLRKFFGDEYIIGYRRGSVADFINEHPELFNWRVLWVKGFHTRKAREAFYNLCSHCQRGKAKIILEDSAAN